MKREYHRKHLGTCKNGYSYWLDKDNYVYQQAPNMEWNGWICDYPSWVRGMSVIAS